MSQENVDVVWTVQDAYGRGDLDAAFALCDEDVAWDASRFEGWMERPIIRGRDEVKAFMTQWLTTWGDLDVTYDLRDVGGDRVFASVRQRMKGGESGVPVELESFQVWTLADGRVMRIDNYTDRAEALEAVELSE